MKKILLVLPFFVLFSCASAPDKGIAPDDNSMQQSAAASVSADKEKSRATDAMNKAKDIKADVAVKDDFSKALGVYNEAETLLASGPDKTAAAAARYLESEKLFLEAYEKAKAKREEALKQLEKARADIKNVESDAAEMEAEQNTAPAGTGG